MNANIHATRTQTGMSEHAQDELPSHSPLDALVLEDGAFLLTAGFCMSQWCNAYFRACDEKTQHWLT